MRIKREVFLDKISSNYPILVSKFNDSPICDFIHVVVESEHTYKSESLLYSIGDFQKYFVLGLGVKAKETKLRFRNEEIICFCLLPCGSAGRSLSRFS